MDNISINPIVFLVFLTFIIGLCFLNKTAFKNRILLYILTNYFFTEIISIFLNYNNIPVGFLYNISILLQFVFWLIILLVIFKKNNLFIVYLFIGLSILAFIYKFIEFNNYNFITGSIIYLIIYIYENIKMLRNEEINFFQTNDYFLISIPIIFFLGMSFLFSFNLNKLTTTIVYDNTNLYTLIIYFVNIIYYSLINFYIHRERKLND